MEGVTPSIPPSHRGKIFSKGVAQAQAEPQPPLPTPTPLSTPRSPPTLATPSATSPKTLESSKVQKHINTI